MTPQNMLDVICDSISDGNFANRVSDWLEEQLGMDGPWTNQLDGKKSITSLLNYKLSEIGSNTLPVRQSLQTSSEGVWVRTVCDQVLPLFDQEM